MKYVICKTINKYLSSNLTSLKSFIEMEDMSTLKKTTKTTNNFSLCWFWFGSILVEWQSENCRSHWRNQKNKNFFLSLSIYAGQGENFFFFLLWCVYCFPPQPQKKSFCQNADGTKTKLSKSAIMKSVKIYSFMEYIQHYVFSSFKSPSSVI